jgi:hypothetical protein
MSLCGSRAKAREYRRRQRRSRHETPTTSASRTAQAPRKGKQGGL